MTSISHQENIFLESHEENWLIYILAFGRKSLHMINKNGRCNHRLNIEKKRLCKVPHHLSKSALNVNCCLELFVNQSLSHKDSASLNLTGKKLIAILKPSILKSHENRDLFFQHILYEAKLSRTEEFFSRLDTWKQTPVSIADCHFCEVSMP